MRRKLGRRFYLGADVVVLARALLGKVMVSRIGGERTAGRIVETEAYCGQGDRACHAYGGRRTQRNEVMYAEGGTAYVYLCYGVHALFNVVTNRVGRADAVLIRAMEPLEGVEVMARRAGKPPGDYRLGAGPGLLTRSLGIDPSLSGTSLLGRTLWIEDHGEEVPASRILASPRVGIGYAGPDAKRPWRFRIRDCPWTSRAR